MPYHTLQDPIVMEFNRMTHLLDQLCKERDDLRAAVAIHERIIELQATGLRSNDLTEVEQNFRNFHDHLGGLERRISSVEHQMGDIMLIFKEPEEVVDGERRLKPALAALLNVIKASLGLAHQAVPEPVSEAPVAEWREDTVEEGRTSHPSRPKRRFMNYFASAASLRQPPATVSQAAPLPVGRPNHPARQYHATQTWRPRPKLSYHDVDAPTVPSFGAPIPGATNQAPVDWSVLYTVDEAAAASIWNHPDYSHRTVTIHPIDRTFPLSTLLQKLNTGYYIESVQRMPSPRVSGSDKVTINFLCFDDAWEYVQLADMRRSLAQIPQTSNTIIKQSETATGALSRYVKDAVFLHGATRIILIQAFPRMLSSPRELRIQLGYIFNHSLDVLLNDPEFGERTIRITFRAVGDAYRAANRWRKTTDPIWRGVKIFFGNDGKIPDLSGGDAPRNDDGHDGPGGMPPPPPPPDSSDDDSDDNDGGPSGGSGPSDSNNHGDGDNDGNGAGPFNFTPQDMVPGGRSVRDCNARRARGTAINEAHRPLPRFHRTGPVCGVRAMPMLAETSFDAPMAPSTSQYSASVYSRTTNGGPVGASTSINNSVASNNAGGKAESSNGSGGVADLEAMPTEDGTTGLGIGTVDTVDTVETAQTVHTPAEVHYYVNGIETDDNGNPLADPDDPRLANIPTHQAAEQNANDAVTTVGNVPVRRGGALPDVVARAMARSKWAD
ncbi:hypothetical protein IWX90DRAFT_483718 [Phyllosticta citrichinensis]|uniref:Uncharacterized protein n=1 Tax=Phyllosticta citrichinensis TaxID=1130410 RepID=A0ABR1Y3Z8_9PEZI